MTEPTPQPVPMRVARRVLAPVFSRLDALRQELQDSRERQDVLAATVEQLSRQVERLEAYQQVTRDELRTEFGGLVDSLPGTADGLAPAEALRRRLDEALLHAEVLAEQSRATFAADVGELRSNLRLTQALVERAGRAPSADAPTGDGPTTTVAAVPERRFAHPAPGFDLLYRAFEDRHRGSIEVIRDRQRGDYLELLSGLANDELPVVDLGCGRGELVELLHDAGHTALGVDSNTGQVHELLGDAAAAERFVESDLFEWLDGREDGSCRAVVSMHVVEHLPLDLQVRLVFEAHRVLAPGGVLVLETPNALSLSTAATNFWVDPTHERPVHPLFLEFLAREAGFPRHETRLLHPIAASFPPAAGAEELVAGLDELVFGSGDLALVAWR
jgi:SAM-dependent methyltransferase